MMFIIKIITFKQKWSKLPKTKPINPFSPQQPVWALTLEWPQISAQDHPQDNSPMESDHNTQLFKNQLLCQGKNFYF